LLQTVLEETRKRSSTNYKKLKEILAERSDNFYVFVNEHHKYHLKIIYFYIPILSMFITNRNTYVERKPGESANDRNDRAIRKACSWYESHLEGSQNMRGQSKKVKVVLLTQDMKNRELAIEEGLSAYKGA